MDVWVGGGREESVVNLNAQAAKAVDSANSNSLQESRVRQNSEIVLNVWFNRNLPLSFTPLLRGFCRDIASLAFQISPRDVFCAVTYIPQYVGYLQKEREREREQATTATRKKYITRFPLKKQIWYSTRLYPGISITEAGKHDLLKDLPRRVPIKVAPLSYRVSSFRSSFELWL